MTNRTIALSPEDSKKLLEALLFGEGSVHKKLRAAFIDKLYFVDEVWYEPDFGDERLCECGHTYIRHFDTYEDMLPCKCKYCDCHEFVAQRTQNAT